MAQLEHASTWACHSASRLVASATARDLEEDPPCGHAFALGGLAAALATAEYLNGYRPLVQCLEERLIAPENRLDQMHDDLFGPFADEAPSAATRLAHAVR